MQSDSKEISPITPVVKNMIDETVITARIKFITAFQYLSAGLQWIKYFVLFGMLYLTISFLAAIFRTPQSCEAHLKIQSILLSHLRIKKD